MTEKELELAIAHLRAIDSDDETYEAKECSQKLSSDVWESVSSFANTEGGTLLLGLSEKNGFTPVRDFPLDKVCDQFIAGMGDGGQEGRLTNPPTYEIERLAFEDSVLLVIHIDELDCALKPCFITARGVQNGSYKRIDDSDIKLSANEIYAFQNATTPSNADRIPVPSATMSDIDKTICDKAIERAKKTAPRALQGADTFEERLRRLNFCDQEGNIMLSGLLAAGYYPQQFFPRLFIDVAAHIGLSKGGAGSYRFKDRVLCEGSVGNMVDDAVGAISKNLRTVSRIVGIGRVDELEIPEGALREAVANAVVHREYEGRFLGEPIAIDIYDDRVEIINPGGLWGKAKSELANGCSTCRNGTLIKLLNYVPIPSNDAPIAEGNGTGIQFIRNECAVHGLMSPEFLPTIDHFKVIFRRPTFSRSVEDAAIQIDEEDILKLIAQQDKVSAREIQEATGLTKRQVGTRLTKLIAAEKIEPTAGVTNRNRKYRLKDA